MQTPKFGRFGKPLRCAWYGMRLLPQQKESIRLASAARGQTMTEYLLWLHERAIGTEASHG